MSGYFADEIKPAANMYLSSSGRVSDAIDAIDAGGECLHVIRLFSRSGRPFSFRSNAKISAGSSITYPGRAITNAWAESGEVTVEESSPATGKVLSAPLAHTQPGVRTIDNIDLTVNADEPNKVALRLTVTERLQVRSTP